MEIDDSAFNLRMNKIATNVQSELEKTILKESIMFKDYVKSEKLSGQVLNHKTGALSESIVAGGIETNGSEVSANISTDNPYAPVHEYGLTINKKSKKGKSFTATYPQRSFMHSSFEDKKSEIRNEIREAVKKGIADGN